jgi:hypothetical protein
VHIRLMDLWFSTRNNKYQWHGQKAVQVNKK